MKYDDILERLHRLGLKKIEQRALQRYRQEGLISNPIEQPAGGPVEFDYQVPLQAFAAKMIMGAGSDMRSFRAIKEARQIVEYLEELVQNAVDRKAYVENQGWLDSEKVLNTPQFKEILWGKIDGLSIAIVWADWKGNAAFHLFNDDELRTNRQYQNEINVYSDVYIRLYERGAVIDFLRNKDNRVIFEKMAKGIVES